jgi:DNA-3-methyladenine glycosylase II
VIPTRRSLAIEEDVVLAAAGDPQLARAAETAGGFEVHLRPPGFATLIWLVLGQQVSIAAAKAMFAKLTTALGDRVEPGGLLALDDSVMRSCGFTRMKAGYARGLANAVLEGTLDLDAVARLPDREAVAALTAQHGIGEWTAENYLIWALGRRDVFPAGDLALREGFRSLAGADAPPDAAFLREIASQWSPRRTAAAFLIWYAYLGERAGD